jgi:hypothetical protein
MDSKRAAIAPLCGLLAFCIAQAAGVPFWTQWHPGDAADIGVLTWLTVAASLRARAESPRHD